MDTIPGITYSGTF